MPRALFGSGVWMDHPAFQLPNQQPNPQPNPVIALPPTQSRADPNWRENPFWKSVARGSPAQVAPAQHLSPGD